MKTREAPDFAPTRDGIPTMRRITPREVLAAYERTGATPADLVYVFKAGGQLNACPVSAITAAHTGEYPDSDATEDYLQERLVLGNEYREGFVLAVDGAGPEHLPDYPSEPDYWQEAVVWWIRAGYRDGRRCRRFVFGEGE